MALGGFVISMSTLGNRFFAEAMSPAFLHDPYPLYDRFRTGGLLQVADTIWFALAHDDVAALLRQPKLSSHESRLSQDPGRPRTAARPGGRRLHAAPHRSAAGHRRDDRR
jgi:cytochrome P450